MSNELIIKSSQLKMTNGDSVDVVDLEEESFYKVTICAKFTGVYGSLLEFENHTFGIDDIDNLQEVDM